MKGTMKNKNNYKINKIDKIKYNAEYVINRTLLLWGTIFKLSKPVSAFKCKCAPFFAI